MSLSKSSVWCSTLVVCTLLRNPGSLRVSAVSLPFGSWQGLGRSAVLDCESGQCSFWWSAPRPGCFSGCWQWRLCSAPSLPFSAPAFESDRGLPVPWSLIVQGKELLKAFSPCLEGSLLSLLNSGAVTHLLPSTAFLDLPPGTWCAAY